MNQRMKRALPCSWPKILAVGLVPSAFAAQDGQTTTPHLGEDRRYSTGYSDQEGAWPRS